MKHLPLNPSIFISNRKRFTEKMAKNAIAIFNSNDEMPLNGDALYPFQQNSDLYWLSGIMQEETMVVLFPDNPDPKYREVLVLVRPNELKEKWDGKRLAGQTKRKQFPDSATVIWLDSLEALLQQWIHLAEIIYLNSNENDRKSSPIQTRDYRYAEEMKEKYPLHKFERSAKILKDLSGVKTKEEVEVMQQAVDITQNLLKEC